MNFRIRYEVIVLIMSVLISHCACAQHTSYQKENFFTIMSYNVENLFDTIDDPNKNDNEFLPDSSNHWNSDRYQKKIRDIARVINAVNKNELPELLGLMELENSRVLQDLISNKLLQPGDYGFVHEESPDERGIDVALLYRKNEFQYLGHEKIPIIFDFEPETKTRDILYVKGKIGQGEILHVFVNHWSSRRDGEELSEPKRLFTAGILRAKLDAVFKKDKDAKIVILGDFNDEPSNKSLCEILMASNNPYPKNKNELYNLMFDKHLLGMGTYFYRGNWNMLDNLIISGSLLNSPGKFEVSGDGGQIFQARWMMYDNVKTGEMTPNRTYGGSNYYGGISDHLPVYLILKK